MCKIFSYLRPRSRQDAPLPQNNHEIGYLSSTLDGTLYHISGAVVVSPTFSLPESIWGVRNW